MTSLVNVVSLTGFVLALSAGQIMFKQLGLAIQGQSAIQGLLLLLRHPNLYIAVAIYGGATLLWIWILSRVPLIQAYPWVALCMVMVPLIGRYYFDERVGSIFWLGLAFILAGVLLTQFASQRP